MQGTAPASTTSAHEDCTTCEYLHLCTSRDPRYDFVQLVTDRMRAPLRAAHGFPEVVLRNPALSGPDRMLLRRAVQATAEIDRLLRALAAYLERKPYAMRPDADGDGKDSVTFTI